MKKDAGEIVCVLSIQRAYLAATFSPIMPEHRDLASNAHGLENAIRGDLGGAIDDACSNLALRITKYQAKIIRYATSGYRVYTYS